MSSTERAGEFYSVWPILDGKQLNLQWGEIRRNTAETKAIVRGSFQDIEDGADSLNALRALIGLAFGEQGFDNKYRLAYNKTTAEFCAQKNDGTEAVPIWQDVWCIRFSDGQFQVVSEGGIQSNAGFYGPLPHDLLAIGEILASGALGGTQFTNSNELYFNTNTGFYLTSVTSGPRAGKPIVNFSFPLGKAKTFAKSGKVWQVAHNFNAKPVMVQAMNDGDVVVIPDKIDVSDPNNAWFYFNEVTSGKAMIAMGGLGAVETISSLAVTDGTNAYAAVEDLNFSHSDFYLTSDLSGSPVVNLRPKLEVTDGINDYLGVEVINLSGADFYLSADAAGEPTINLLLDDLSVNDGIHTHTSVQELNFNTANFYLTADAQGEPVVNIHSVDITLGDHGSLQGLSDDDHSAYPLVDMSRGFDNAADATATLQVSSGLTTSKIVQIGLADQGTNKWLFKKNVANSLVIKDVATGTEPFVMEPGAANNTLVIDADSKVGVGTAAPTAKLHVAGDTLVDDKVVAEAFYLASGGNWDSLGLDVDGTLQATTGDFSGDVTISTANGPTVLAINGTAGFNRAALDFQVSGTTKWRMLVTTDNAWSLQDDDAGTNPLVLENNCPSNTLRLDGSGYVGIGTANPTSSLHVAGDGLFEDKVVGEAFYTISGGAVLDEKHNLKMFHAHNNAEVVNIGIAGATELNDILLQVELVKDDIFTHAADAAAVTINAKGLYEVDYTVSGDVVSGNGTRNTLQHMLFKDVGDGFYGIQGTQAWGYHRQATQGKQSSTSHTMQAFNSGDIIKIRTQRDPLDTGTLTMKTLTYGSSLSIKLLRRT